MTLAASGCDEKILFDTHVNLHSERFDADRVMVLDRARAAGVGAFIAICDRPDSMPAIRSMTPDKDIWRSIGVHPHHAKDYVDLTAESLIKAADCDDRICAIGESGLDYHYNHSAPDAQRRLFRIHIEAAEATGLPLIIHCRNADADMIEMFEVLRSGLFTPLLHCYTGGKALAEIALEAGAFFSVSGILAFRNAHDVRAVMRDVPLDRVVLETDSPYLAPPPHRGERNEPAFLSHVCAALADLHRMEPQQIAGITTRNAHRLFSRTCRVA